MKSSQEDIIQRIMKAYSATDDEMMSKCMGCTKSSVSNYRHGRRKIPINLIMKVSEETGHSTDWLLTGNSPKANDTPVAHQVVDHETYQQDTESLLEIYKHGNPKTISAIHANLEEFVEKVRYEKKVAELEETVASQGVAIEAYGKAQESMKEELKELKSQLSTMIHEVPKKTANGGA